MNGKNPSQSTEPVRSGQVLRLALFARISGLARSLSEHPAIMSSNSAPLSYAALFDVVDNTVTHLRKFGIQPDGRVAVVMPAGPEFAVALIAVAAGAVCVPLNAGLADNDWQNYFRNLKVGCLLTIPGTNEAAELAATELDLPVVELKPLQNAGAGAFELKANIATRQAESGYPGLQQDAFLLTTSGTTSRPKAVPLTHLNICHSATNTGTALRLTSADRLLSVLPLHHPHGLISGLLASVFAGSSVIVMRRFNAQDFFELLKEFQPTWYTAVPAIHQAITVEASRQAQLLKTHSLRLIRSASASLPRPQLMELERLFRVPVIETYGMTEAASQIASNPLPPKARKVGSVGIAAGPEIEIRDENDQKQNIGESGEIVLRGANLTRGYDGETTDASRALNGDWFRTGDIGRIDEEGYLYLVGRTKELINRGGEKIAPRKVEDVLLDHPEIAEAVAFSTPHPRLGEDVAAAVVLRSKTQLSARDIRTFALRSNKLAHTEVPRQIVVVDEIPKSSTGKIRRNNMAKSLGLADASVCEASRHANYVAPETEIEQCLTDIWCAVFELSDVGTQDDFFLLGGDSLLAIQVAIQVADIFDVSLSLRTLFEAPTIAELAQRIVDTRSPHHETFTLSHASQGAGLTRSVSVSQENILQLEQNFKGLPIFTAPMAFVLSGEFDAGVFQKSVKALIFRHEILRTIYKFVGGTWKSTPSNAISSKISVEDWKIIPEANQLEFAQSIVANEAWASFDLTSTAPFRIRILRFSENHHIVILSIHHMIMDAWTVQILVGELFRHYDALILDRAPALQRPEFQFSDFARWQREWCGSKQARLQLDYWKSKLDGAVPVFSSDRGQGATGPGFGTGHMPVHLSNGLVGRLAELSRGEHCTLFMALLAGLKVFLMTKYGQSDICIATPMANRSRPNTEYMVGLIQNTVVIRMLVCGDKSFRSALGGVRDTVLDAHAHQELPFEVLLFSLGKAPSHEIATVSDIYFSVGSFYEPDVEPTNLTVKRMANTDQQESLTLPVNSAKCMFILNQTRAGVTGSCIYKESQFSAAEARKMVLGYQHVLEFVSANPDLELNCLPGIS